MKESTMSIKIRVERVHDKDPKSGFGVNGDYVMYRIFINDKLEITYGDHYHEKGQEKADGFVDAINSIEHLIPGGVSIELRTVEEEGLV